jgi:hypothetical protein
VFASEWVCQHEEMTGGTILNGLLGTHKSQGPLHKNFNYFIISLSAHKINLAKSGRGIYAIFVRDFRMRFSSAQVQAPTMTMVLHSFIHSFKVSRTMTLAVAVESIEFSGSLSAWMAASSSLVALFEGK